MSELEIPSDATLDPARLLDILSQVDPQSAFFRQASQLLDQHLAPGLGALPQATPRRPGFRPLLTIGMATYDDYDGVYFSVQAIRMYHPEIAPEIEILVVDNHPEGKSSRALKALEKWIEHYRYIPAPRPQGTSTRDLVFREAAGDFVLCMDSHVFLAPGALHKLMNYLRTHSESRDLLQGPLLYDDFRRIATHFDPVWSAGMWGVWAEDARGSDPASPPFEIPAQGLGVFACRREVWPGLNPRLSGFGGEEGYLHEKFRRAGGRTLCLPFLRWLHRFERPSGAPYRLNWEDRVRNYLVAFQELQMDPEPVIRHFQAHLGVESAQTMAAKIRQEIADPFYFFDAIYCINLDRETQRWERVMQRFERLGIAHRVRRFAAIETSWSHHVGCALSHRAILAEAQAQGLHNLLVFEDDVMFSADATDQLRINLAELPPDSWSTLYLGGCRWGRTFQKAPGCRHLEVPRGLTSLHAIAYHERIFARILADIPETPSNVALWLRRHYGIDQYYANVLDGIHLITSPIIASQPPLLPSEERRFD